jgi:hypothetical protein
MYEDILLLADGGGTSPRNRAAASGAAAANRECRDDEDDGSGFTIRQAISVNRLIGRSAESVIGGIVCGCMRV